MLLPVLEFFEIMLPGALLGVYLAYYYTKICDRPIITHENERLPASLVGKLSQ